jgi:magnesium-transporting ATPase (P-type)
MNIMDGQACIDQRNRLTEDNQLSLISFSSSRKRASVVVRFPAKAG